jgi:hypothetical protein
MSRTPPSSSTARTPAPAITPELLEQAGVVRSLKHPIKILATGELTKKLTVHAHGFSAKAAELIEAAGGSVVRLGAPAEPEPVKTKTRRKPKPVAEVAEDVQTDAEPEAEAVANAEAEAETPKPKPKRKPKAAPEAEAEPEQAAETQNDDGDAVADATDTAPADDETAG